MPTKDTGRHLLNHLFGENFSANRDPLRNDFNGAVFDYIEEVNFGTLWQRPGISLKRRLELTIGILVALGRLPQAKAYMQAALATGELNEAELQEILLHTAVYAGLPAAMDGFAAAEEVMCAMGRLPAK